MLLFKATGKVTVALAVGVGVLSIVIFNAYFEGEADRLCLWTGYECE
jgi:hypothetical protein